MATIAEQLIGNVSQGIEQTGQNLQQGAQLAQTVQNMQVQRQQLDQKKQELDMAKWSKFGELTKIGAEMPEGPARNAFLKNTLTAAGQALLPNQIHPQVTDQLTKDPNMGSYLQDQVKAGHMSMTEMKQTLADPELYAKMYSSDDFKSHMAAKDLEPYTVKPNPEDMSPELTAQAKGLIGTPLRQGDITMADIYRAKQDPDKMKVLLAKTGLDRVGGEQALDNVINTYPKALSEAEKEGIQNKANAANAQLRVGPQEDRVTLQFHQNGLDKINAPTSVPQKKLGAFQSIDNALAAFKASGGMPQEFEQLQTQLRLNQGATGGRTGVNERASAHASDLGITRDQYVQIATGSIQNVDLSSPKLVKAIKEVAATELGQIKTQAFQSLDTLATGRKSFYKQHKALGADYQDSIDAIKGQFQSTAQQDASAQTFNVLGHQVTADRAKAFYQAHPDIKPDAQMKKALGL